MDVLCKALCYTSAVLLLCRLTLASPGLAPELTLSDGSKIPALALGTCWAWTPTIKIWSDKYCDPLIHYPTRKIHIAILQFLQDQDMDLACRGSRLQPQGEVQRAVEWAIEAGYRHIDTAAIYSTETEVGAAIAKKIKEQKVKREELFITTKLWSDSHQYEAVLPSIRESLKKLGLEYVDLYLVHWPVAIDKSGAVDDSVGIVDTWRGMQRAHELGLARHVGLSNFNQHQMDRIFQNCSLQPQLLQIEVNLNLQQGPLLEYCRQKKMVVMGYTPFGSLFKSKSSPLQTTYQDPVVSKIAQKHNKTAAQIALRYLVQLGVIPIPKSVTKARIEDNIKIFDFTLDTDDVAELKTLDSGYRTISQTKWKHSAYYPFNSELESKVTSSS